MTAMAAMTAMTPLNRITLFPPAIDRRRRTATFRWRVEPETPLYRRTSFTPGFPAEVDLASVPEPLWWTVAMLCLHPHWNLLRRRRVNGCGRTGCCRPRQELCDRLPSPRGVDLAH